MLYVTTRGKNDAFTAARTMNSDRGPDGGLFIPMRLPVFTKEEIIALADRSYGQNVADILNLFFATKLTAWEVEMSIGRTPCKFRNMNYRIIVSELWHNMSNHFDRAINVLAQRIHPDGQLIGEPSNWVKTAVRIASLFGMFGELQRTGQVRVDAPVDVAVPAGSFSAPMAAWYGRKMGLPIGTIICGCNENSAPWDLLNRGQLDTGSQAVSTNTPDGDLAVPPDLERLICETCDQSEAMNFYWSCAEGGVYAPSQSAYDNIRKGMAVAVISRSREEMIIPSVYHTSKYILDPYSALAYGALSDHRARNGSSRTVLLICERSPICSSETVANSMRITVSELKRLVIEL